VTVSSSSRGARPGAASGGDQVTGVPLSVRLRRWRPFILAVGLLLIVTVVGTLTESQHSKTPFAIDNPKHDGTQALARLLRQEGVSVETVRSQEAAVRAAEPGTTVALLDAGLLTEDERSELARTGADVVVVGALYQDLSGLTDPVELTSSGQSAPADTVLTSQCPDADAAAAESMAGSRGSVQLGEGTDATGCFPIAQGEDRTGYAYAIDATGGGGAPRVIADADVITNSRLAEAGHAALAIRALGHHEHVVWFDASQQQIPTVWDTVSTPPWMPVLLAQGVVIVCATLLTACSVCVSGIVAWVGLLIPHFARMLAGANNTKSLPVSIFIGAIFLLFVDTLARTISVSEVPLGVLTGFIGTIFFVWVLWRNKKVA